MLGGDGPHEPMSPMMMTRECAIDVGSGVLFSGGGAGGA